MKIDPKDFEALKQNIFKLLCNSAVSIMNYNTILVPVPYLARIFNVSKYMVRKAINSLRNEGLVESGIDSWYDDYFDQQIIARGFTITQKAKETDVYKKAEIYEQELIVSCFGI